MTNLFDTAPVEQIIELCELSGYTVIINDGHCIKLVKEVSE